jgi:hypothetical protein
MNDQELAPDWPFRECAKCGHLGFSHDNAADCAECDCGGFES